MNKEELYNFCKNITKKENIDFKYIKVNNQEINFNNFSLEKYTQNINDRLFIRVIENNKIGTYSIQDIRKEKIIEGIKKAKEIAKLKISDVKYNTFGKDRVNKKIKFDQSIKEIEFKDVIEDVKKNIKKDKYIEGYVGGLSKTEVESFYLNKETEKENTKSYISIHTGILTKNKTKSSGDFFNTFTKKEDINISLNFNQAKVNAYNQLDPVNGDKGEYTLILTPEVTRDLINYILGATIGDVIEKKKSFLQDKIGKKIFSENITITENPHVDYFLKSEKIDDEGFKTTNKEIFKKGVFKKPIYDLYSSIKYNQKPTGNGFLSNNYSSNYTNIFLEEGREKIDDVINKTKKGILVYSIIGLHTNRINNSDISVTIASGKEINNGKFTKTITNLNFSGNIFEILKEVSFSKEQKFSGSSLFSFAIIPKIKLI